MEEDSYHPHRRTLQHLLTLFSYVVSLSPYLVLLNNGCRNDAHFLCGNPKVHRLCDLPWPQNQEGLS